MLISAVFQWAILILVIILALTIASRVASGVDTERDDNVGFVAKLISTMWNLAGIAVFIGILFALVYVYEGYTSSYTIITEKEGKVEATAYALVGESSYDYSNGTTILLSQSTSGTTYLNDSSHDILIRPVSYGNYNGSSSDKSLSDVIIPSMQTYIDLEDSISLDYVAQSISDIKESDETGLKFYLIPLSD